jgi:hypothetical protein
MKTDTRRRFIKRTGAVTLGSYLGLGVIPVRQLRATDGSSVTNQFLTGIKFNVPWIDAPHQGNPLGTPNEDTKYTAQHQATYPVTDGMGNSGTVTITTYNSADALPNICSPSLRMETKWKIDYDMVDMCGDAFVHYKGTMNIREVRNYECISGVITMLTEERWHDGGIGTPVLLRKVPGGSDIAGDTYPGASPTSPSYIDVKADGSGVRLKRGSDNTAYQTLTRHYELRCCVP